MILYIIIVFIAIITLFFGYVRVKYKFWALQPVFHYYNIFYWFKDVGVIELQLPIKNKYYNSKIITTKMTEVSTNKLNEIIRLIESNYILNKENKLNKFIPKVNTFLPYFNSHNIDCFCSTISEPSLLQDAKTNEIISVDKIIGIITSRPLHVELNQIIFDIYYIDYLCVDKSKRQQGIAPQLIQTHEYNQRRAEQSVKVCLFKREDELTGIIPICAYDTYGFPSDKWEITGTTPMLKCDKQNIHHLFDFFKTNKSKFELLIYPEISNLLELVITENVIIYMLMNLEMATIQCAYFFRKSCTFISYKTEVLACFASINATATVSDFVRGFKTAVCTIKKTRSEYNCVSIERISHSASIIEDLVQKTTPQISKTAYFFYNFGHHSLDANKVLIIN